MQRILIVDDVEFNRDILAEIFEDQFEVMEAEDGEQAIQIIDELRTDISLIYLDLMMPKKTGLEVLSYMQEQQLIEQIPVIMITGESSIESDIKAYDFGVADIVYKPFSAKVIMRRTMNLLEQYKTREHIKEELQQMTEELRKSKEEMEKTNDFLLEALGSVVEFRSLESGEHIQRVKIFTRIILENLQANYPEYGLTQRKIDLITSASTLHDVGKIAISDEILKAPRKLTAEEFEEMKKHTIYGCEILHKFERQTDDLFKYCYDICRWHHEKIDGKGYPDGLQEEEIPIYCQVVSLADCFDALISKRVYKDAFSCEEAFQMILRGECGAFSENVLKCFTEVKNELFAAFDEIEKSIFNL